MKHILLVFLAGFNLAMSQTVLLTPFNAPQQDKSTAHLKDFKLFQLDVKSIQDILNNTKGHIYRVNLKTPDQVFQLELYEFSILAENRVRNTGGVNGIVRLPKRIDIRTFKGIVNGQNNSVVSVTIADGFFNLMMDDHINKYFLEPYADVEKQFQSEGDQQKFIFYKDKDVLPMAGMSCAATDLKKGIEQIQSKSVQIKESSFAPCPVCAEIQIGLAADWTMIMKYGGANTVDAFFSSNIAMAQAAFTNPGAGLAWDFSLVITGTYFAPDKNTDPFLLNLTLGSELATFRAQGPTLFAGSDYDVATVWSTKFPFPNEEIADQAGCCTSNKYSVASSYLAGDLNSSNYATEQAHVIGHLFNCTHEGLASGNFIMNPYAVQSLSWSSQSQRDIFVFVMNNGLIGTCLSICPNSGIPIPEFSADITYGCQPVTVKFKDLSTVTTKWKWKFLGGTPDSSLLQNPVIVYKKAGSYPVTLIASNAKCTSELTKYDFIVINDVPVADFSYGIQDQEVFFIDQSARPNEWHWKFGDGDVSDEQFPTHKYLRDSTYEVTLTVINDCGTNTVKKKILVESTPIADFNSDTTAGCAPQIIKFFDQSSNNVKTWQWDFPGGTPNSSTKSNPVIRYDHPGKYDVRLTVYATKFHSGITKQIYITIDSIPIAAFTDSINVGKVIFTNQSIYAKSHFWIFGDNTTSSDSNPTHNYTEGIYHVKYVAINSCGTDTAETTFTIGVKPTASFQTNTTKDCIPFQVQYQNSSIAATSYRWYFPGGNPANSTDPNPLITYNTAGKFNVSLVAANVFYSDSIGKTDFIEARTTPSGTFTSVISGFKSTFTNSTIDGTNYLWDFGDTKLSFAKDPPVHDYGVEGEFNVRLIVSNECGEDTINKHIAVYLVPKVNFTVNSTKGCVPYTVQFFDKSSVDVIEWDWQFENGNPATSKEKNPIVIFNKIGKYTVKLTVKNTNGSNARTITQYIQVVSTVLCPEQTKTKPFQLSENPFGVDFENRADYSNQQFPIIYPNPAQDYIYVYTNASKTQPVHIQIFDLSGRRLSTHVSMENEFRIQTDKLKGGAYYIKMNDGLNSSFSKFVISE